MSGGERVRAWWRSLNRYHPKDVQRYLGSGRDYVGLSTQFIYHCHGNTHPSWQRRGFIVLNTHAGYDMLPMLVLIKTPNRILINCCIYAYLRAMVKCWRHVCTRITGLVQGSSTQKSIIRIDWTLMRFGFHCFIYINCYKYSMCIPIPTAP